jgi:hypothetical protein
VSVPRLRLRAVRIAAVTVAALLGFVAICALLVPLLFRGPRLVWAVHRFMPPTQGEIRLGGGHLGVGSLFALALGRPITVVLDDLTIRDPEGTEVFWAARLRAAVVLQRHPLQVVIHDLRPGQSRWRLASMRTRPAIGFVAAFFLPGRRVPPAPRPTTAPPPAVPAAPRPPAAAAPLVQVRIASAHLDGLDATFDFPEWALELKDIRASGSFWASLPPPPGAPPIGFEVRDIDARAGGGLRILRGVFANRVPFDRARLDWIGTPNHSPADLLLLVAGAATGRSRLSGRALFAGLFAMRGMTVRRGMDIDADWGQAGDALSAAAAARGLRGLRLAGEGARLRTTLRGSYRDVRARFEAAGFDVAYGAARLLDLGLELTLAGPPLQLVLDRLAFRAPGGGRLETRGQLVQAGDARLRVRIDQLATTQLLPPYLRPLLGGTADGWLAARGDLARGSFVLEGMDLGLRRERRGPLPHAIQLTTGRAPAQPADDRLVGRIEGLRYQGGVLGVRRLDAAAFGARLSGSSTLALAGNAPGKAPRLDASWTVSQVDLRRALPGRGLSGAISLAMRARGPLDDLVAQARFPAGARVTIFDQPYGLPQALSAQIQGDLLLVPRFSLQPPGGGRITVGGRVIFDKEIALDLQVDHHRLDRLPLAARALPGMAGTLSGNLRLRSQPQLTVLDGRVEVDASQLSLAALVPSLPGLGRAEAHLAGRFDLQQSPQRPLALQAELDSLALAYGCAGPGGQGCTRLESVAPVKLRAAAGPTRRVELLQARLRSEGSDFSISGKLDGAELQAQLAGRLSVALLEPLYRRWPVALSGSVHADLQARGSAAAPRIQGTLRLAEPLAVRGRARKLELQLSEGTFTVDEGALGAAGLRVVGHGLALRIDGEVKAGPRPDRLDPLRLRIDGQVSLPELSRSFPELVDQASGTLQVAARLGGTLDEPRLEGQLDFGTLAARVHAAPDHAVKVVVQPGRVEARANRITIAGLTADLSPGGHLVIGPADRPARIDLAKLVPFVLGEIQLPLRGERLNLNLPWLTLQQGTLDVLLAGDATTGPLRLTGKVELGAGRYRPTKQPKPGAIASSRVARRLPRSMQPAMLPVLLDLQVVSNGERFTIDPGWLPDLHMGFDVKVGGTAIRPQVRWEAAPRGLYSRLMFFLYRLFS